jgi:glycosyltransferase involved in cell wall biosynthesis
MQYGLPGHYFLSLGRFVPKKNLATLIRAYRLFLDASQVKQTHLVLVGSGEEGANLRALCLGLHLPIYEKAGLGRDGSARDHLSPGVHFYGFRQIDEIPVFYGLADAFVLPSLIEEWGLVVNEAMASSIPVVVSETAGCAEDLLEPGWPPAPNSLLGVGIHERLGRGRCRLRRNGFLFHPRSPEALANALLFLESIPGLRSAMGTAGRSIVEKFSCAKFATNALLAAETALGATTSQLQERLNLPTLQRP